jgi:hypothetical protein
MIETYIQLQQPARDVLNPERAGALGQLRLAPTGGDQVLAVPLADREDAPQILAVLNAAVEQYGRSPWIRQFTQSILPPWTGNNDLPTIIGAVAAFVRDRMRYLADPEGGEWFIDPVASIQAIQANGFAFGDCDDHVSLLCSMLRSVGLGARAVGVHLHDPVLWDHVIAQVWFGGQWLDIDPCVKTNETPDYREKLISQ